MHANPPHADLPAAVAEQEPADNANPAAGQPRRRPRKGRIKLHDLVVPETERYFLGDVVEDIYGKVAEIVDGPKKKRKLYRVVFPDFPHVPEVANKILSFEFKEIRRLDDVWNVDVVEAVVVEPVVAAVVDPEGPIAAAAAAEVHVVSEEYQAEREALLAAERRIDMGIQLEDPGPDLLYPGEQRW